MQIRILWCESVRGLRKDEILKKRGKKKEKRKQVGINQINEENKVCESTR